MGKLRARPPLVRRLELCNGHPPGTGALSARQSTMPLATDMAPADLAGSITFIGTATVLIRFGGFTILTDPNFLHGGERIHLGYGLHARRLTEPALAIEQLPELDLVVLSHMHEDHFDRV